MPLTPEQRASLWQPDGSPITGLRIVSARPGTGKTTTLTEYCIGKADRWSQEFAPWQGMAITSYTNVAKDELERKVREGGRAHRLLSAPHFVGTIDAFVNQYIFLPFGAGHMGYKGGRPRLVGEPHSIWQPWGLVPNNLDNAYSPMFFDCYTVGADAKPIVLKTPNRKVGGNNVRTPTTDPAKMLGLKQQVWRLGYALQSDANYIAYALLCSSERLTKALVGRFPILVVDEAQDMTEVQHALIDHLRAAGLANIVLIGDEFQAIYEWNTARPQLFVSKSSDATWNPKTIADTFRCSPAICTTLTKLSGGQHTLQPAPSGKNVNYQEPVGITPYADATEREDILAAINDVASRLSGTRAHDGNAENVKTVAVVARSREHAAQLQSYFSGASVRPAEQIVWEQKLTKDYLRVVHHLDRGDRYGAATAYERLLLNHRSIATRSSLRTELARDWSLGTQDIFSYRIALFDDLAKIESKLPTLDVLSVAGCVGACNVQLKGIRANDLKAVAGECGSFATGDKRRQDRPLAALFDSHEERVPQKCPPYDVRLLFSTVHGVKGETYDGVVFYTRAQTGSCGCPTSSNTWARILGHKLTDCESKRIAYVALSRSAQILQILAPSTVLEVWRSFT